MLYGSETPRVFTPPLRELTPDTTLGYALIEFAEDVCGVGLLPWQKWLAVHALELNDDGSFRFRVIIVLVARQNGKTVFSEVLALFFLYVLCVSLVIGTAQSLDLAEEVWDAAIEIAEANDDLSAEIADVSRRNGKKQLVLASGGRYAIKAATRKGGRGFSGDLVLMDELREHTTWDAWGAVSKTTMARKNAIILCMSNAGDAESVVLRHLRAQAHRDCGDPDGLWAAIGDALAIPEDIEDDIAPAIFEWSAPPGCDKWDRSGWAMADPSLGHVITERAMASACATDPDEVFRTECLCQWVEAVAARPFPDGAWEAALEPGSSIPDDAELSFGIDMSADRRMTSLAVCGERPDGTMHVEVIGHQGGVEWAKQALARLAARYGGVRVAMQGRGATVSSYRDDIGAIEGVELVPCEGADVGAWCGRFYDAVVASIGDSPEGSAPIAHLDQPVLDEAARCAQKRGLGDGAWGWDRRSSKVDISPLVAVTMAYGLATSTERKRELPSAYEDHDLIVI